MFPLRCMHLYILERSFHRNNRCGEGPNACSVEITTGLLRVAMWVTMLYKTTFGALCYWSF